MIGKFGAGELSSLKEQSFLTLNVTICLEPNSKVYAWMFIGRTKTEHLIFIKNILQFRSPGQH